MAELITQVSCGEAVKAAVNEGADAVILVFDTQKRIIPSIGSEIKEICDYCRSRDVRVYASVEMFPNDGDFVSAVNYAKTCWKSGVDAGIFSDIGLIKAVSESIPSMPVHAGRRVAAFSGDDIRVLAAMGCKRIYLPKELTLDEIRAVSQMRIETCVAVQGDMCSSVDSFCMMSDYCDGICEDRDTCSRACKRKFNVLQNRNEYPLSIKDVGLVKHTNALLEAGVTGFVINGLGRAPEYTAIVTKIYRECLDEPETSVSYDKVNALSRAQLGTESTDRFLTGKKGALMTGGADYNGEENPLYQIIRDEYMRKEYPRIPVDYVVILKHGEKAKLAVRDDKGNIATVEGFVPRTEGTFEARRSMIVRQCRMSDNSPFRCVGVRTVIDDNVFYSAQDMGKLVSKALSELVKKRYVHESRRVLDYDIRKSDRKSEETYFTVSVLKQNQLSDELYALKPRVVYLPIEELKTVTPQLRPFIDDGKISVCAVLPKVLKIGEIEKLTAMMKIISTYGVDGVCVSSLSQALMGMRYGFTVRGDIGLHIKNSEMMAVAEKLGLTSAILHPTLTAEEIEKISKPIDTEAVVYGRIPLMYTENCILKNNSGFCLCDKPEKFTDTQGNSVLVSGDFGCRNTVYSGRKLFLADNAEHLSDSGIWGKRLCFTSENANECVMILKRYMGTGSYRPAETFRGIYEINETEE